MRAAVAAEYGFALYKQYGEEEAAALIRRDHTTLKRWRRQGKVPFVPQGDRNVRYLGIHIADILLFGTETPPDEEGPTFLRGIGG